MIIGNNSNKLVAFIGALKVCVGLLFGYTLVAGNDFLKASEKPVKIGCSQAELDAVS